MKGINIKLRGMVVILVMFKSLLGRMCKIWKVGYRYYLGKIFRGVVKGFVGLLIMVGLRIVNLVISFKVLRM